MVLNNSSTTHLCPRVVLLKLSLHPLLKRILPYRQCCYNISPRSLLHLHRQVQTSAIFIHRQPINVTHGCLYDWADILHAFGKSAYVAHILAANGHNLSKQLLPLHRKTTDHINCPRHNDQDEWSLHCFRDGKNDVPLHVIA